MPILPPEPLAQPGPTPEFFTKPENHTPRNNPVSSEEIPGDIISNKKNPTKNTGFEELKKYNSLDFANPQKINDSIDYAQIHYPELFLIIKKSIQEHGYSPYELKQLFQCASDPRLRLAIIENLPYFKGSPESENSQEILRDTIIDYTYQDESDSKFDRDLQFIPYSTLYDERREYDIIVTAAIENLAIYGPEAEHNMILAFNGNRETEFKYNQKLIEDEKARGRYIDITPDSNKSADYYSDEYGNTHTAEWGEMYFTDKEGDLSDGFGEDMKDEFEINYFYHKRILDGLLKIKTQKSADFAVDFIKNDPLSTYLYKSSLIALMQNDNINYSAKKLIELLNHTDVDIRKRSSSCLLRLELGKINISDEGVRYLEKIYDLGELNNPGYFAQRLTAKGDVGIFDDHKILQKYFNLGDLSSKEKIIQPKIHDFVYETLFFSHKNETSEQTEQRERYLQEFKENYFGFYEQDFFKKTGILFNNLNFQEQGWFLIFYHNAKYDNKEILLDFASKHGENGLKSFLSLEFGQEMGDKILSIGQRFDQATADLIFAKYAELADFAQSSAEYLASQFESKDPKVAQQVAEHLLLRGKQLLVLCAEDKTITAQQVLEKLNSIKAEVEIFKTSFAAIKISSGSFSLENIKTTKFKITNGESLLSEKEILDRMQEIYAQNYAGFPEAFKEKIKESLEKRLANPKTDFYCLYHQNKIAAFCSMLQQEDGTVHFANFNVAPEYAASQIGNAMMEASLDEVAKNFPIVAEAVPGLKITDTYLNKKGFKKTGEIEVAGVKLWQIRKEKTSDAA
ncbi:MAG: GNAT family N-acetyltransferase [Candidatus Moranbacteria bacterium]|nr:GNAT family N-acetyltransferase [Candidatus Moranbacteria bacterium]